MIQNIKENLLIARIRKNDAEAFAEIYDEYIKKIYRFVSYRVAGRELAEDITQEVFTDLLAYFKKTNHYVDYVQALIYQIARNKIASHYEKHGQVKTVELLESQHSLEGNDDLKSEVDLEEEVDLQKNIEVLLKELQEWDDVEAKEIIMMRFMEQLSHKEIAKILEKSEGNVRVITHRAVKDLKKKLTGKLKK